MTGADYVEFGEGVDIDLLADFIGGALAGTPDEAEVAALIATDEGWRAAHAALSGGMDRVGAALASWEPEPMPAEFAERLDALFAAPVSGAPGVEQRERDRAGVGPRAAGRQDVVLQRKKRNGPGAGDGNGPGRGTAAAARRRRFVTPIAIAAGVIAFLGFGADYLAGRDMPASEDSKSAAGDAPRVNSLPAAGTVRLASGIDYTAATLALTPPRAPLAEPGSADASPGLMAAEPTPPSGLDRLSASEALLACLHAIEAANGAGEIVTESVDFARYDGSPALIVRFQATNGSWVWAVGPQCGSSGGGAAEQARVPLR